MNFTEEELAMVKLCRQLRSKLFKHKESMSDKEWLQKKYDTLYDTLHEIEEYLTGEAEIR